MLLPLIVGFLSFLGHACANPISATSMQVVKSRSLAPSGFTFSQTADPDASLNLRLGLQRSNIDGLIDNLYEVSTPSNARWGQFLSKEEVCDCHDSGGRIALTSMFLLQVEEFMAPTPDTTAAVTHWLDANNVSWSTISPAGDWIGISVTVEEANRLLDADFAVFHHDSSGKRLTRTLSYSLPSDLVGVIEVVHPTSKYA